MEGAGKSARCAALVDSLGAMGMDVVHTREPGGPPVSEKIRSILLDADLEIAPLTELMLYLASRASNLELLIKPALQAGKHVICERYSDATLAYQVGGRGLPRRPVIQADILATEGFVPDVTILLDIDPAEGFRRIGLQGRVCDRIEKEGLEFHRRVRRQYLDLAEGDSRFMVIDAALAPEKQDRIILARVTGLLSRRNNRAEG